MDNTKLEKIKNCGDSLLKISEYIRSIDRLINSIGKAGSLSLRIENKRFSLFINADDYTLDPIIQGLKIIKNGFEIQLREIIKELAEEEKYDETT